MSTALHSSSSSSIVGVPKLSMRRWCGGQRRRGVIHYEESDHMELPHVVKFSGGRSSGLMLLSLLENRLLQAERGDVVLFTNTSAEHPSTYDFVRKMKRVTEKSGIPFFLAEWQTMETVVAGEWKRKPTYRLVNGNPLSRTNPNGYSHRGEVFEEAVTWGGMLPSVHTRVCTTLMKMFVTREFLADWFAARKVIPKLGHSARKPQLNPLAYFRSHRAGRGTMTFEEMQNRCEILAKRPFSRPEQWFEAYTKAPIPSMPNSMLKHCIFGQRCSLFGDQPAPFLTFLGFRAGEDMRYLRMIHRNLGKVTPGHDTHPPGEYSYAPLHNLGIDQVQVLDFWARQPGRIRPHLPTDMNLSNCVFCFLKGPRALTEINRDKSNFEKRLPKKLQAECRKRNTPNSVSWWTNLEERHKRRARKTQTDGGPSFGMFGLTELTYESIQNVSKKARKQQDEELSKLNSTPNCECTD